MKKLIYLCLIIAVGFAVSSCKDKKEVKKQVNPIEENPQYDNTMERSAADTTALVQMATQYLDLLKENKIDEAMAMLHDVDTTGVQPLSEAHRKSVINNLKKFPVLSYQLEEFRLYSDDQTEMRYVYEFMPKPEGSPDLPNTMKGLIGFFRVDGQWYMTIPDLTTDPTINDLQNAKAINR